MTGSISLPDAADKLTAPIDASTQTAHPTVHRTHDFARNRANLSEGKRARPNPGHDDRAHS
jgi:hypothetical protein